MLDNHVLWVEGMHSPRAGQHFGPGTVALRVLPPQDVARAVNLPDSIWVEGDQVVAVGTTRRVDPATGQLAVARFRHMWRVIYDRVVNVERSTVLLPVSQTTDRHTDYH